MKLILVATSLFIGEDLPSKTLAVLLFLYASLLIRKKDPPFLTRKLNNFDLNSAYSLMIIYYSLMLTTFFDDNALSVFVLIILIITNLQFFAFGIRALLLFAIYRLLQNAKINKIRKLILKCFSGNFHFFKFNIMNNYK